MTRDNINAIAARVISIEADALHQMVGDVPFSGDNPIAFIMGPCQLENRDHAMMMAERVANAYAPTESKFVFKTSYDKPKYSHLNIQTRCFLSLR